MKNKKKFESNALKITEINLKNVYLTESIMSFVSSM